MTGTYTVLDIREILRANAEVAKLLRPRADEQDGIYRAIDADSPIYVSTSRELAQVSDQPVWDVNGYYRALGVAFPFKPTRAEMRQAYLDNHRSLDRYATYGMTRLLDREFRAHYDARPIGEPVDDKYRWEEMRRLAAAWAAAETIKRGELVTEEEFIGAIVAKKMTEAAEEEALEESEAVEEPMIDLSQMEADWPFGFWLWGSRKRDERVLSEWQCMLSEELWAKRLRVRLGVGYVGHLAEPSVRVRHDQLDIVLLHEGQEPTQELAALVAQGFVDTPPDTPLTTPLLYTLENHTPIHVRVDETPIVRDANSISKRYAERHANYSEEESAMSDDVLDFASGGEQAAQIAKSEAAARKSKYNRTFLGSLLADDGDSIYGRFLTDEPQWIETKQHGSVMTKAAPQDKPSDKTWPEAMGAVCRYTPVGVDRHPAYGDCFVCDNKLTDKYGKASYPGMRLWALLAVREPVMGTQAMVDSGQIKPHLVDQIVSFQDKVEEVEEVIDGKATGNKTTRKVIVIVNMAQKNFFSPLLTFKAAYGTVVDRDYKIVRKGAKQTQSVQYEFAPMNPTYAKDPETQETVVFDLRDPKFAANYEGHGMSLADLRKHISEQCSKEHYDRFFDTRVEVSWERGDRDDSTPSTAAAPSAAQQAGQSATSEPTSGPTKEAMDAMRAKLLEASPAPQTTESEPAPVVVLP